MTVIFQFTNLIEIEMKMERNLVGGLACKLIMSDLGLSFKDELFCMPQLAGLNYGVRNYDTGESGIKELRNCIVGIN